MEGSLMRSLLVVQNGAINTRMGAGQRTRVCFNALKSLGHVDVVILGEKGSPKVNEFFPNASSVQWVQSSRFPVIQKKGINWVVYNLKRFLFLKLLYGPEPKVVNALSKILTNEHKIVLCRYSLTFCVTGLSTGDNLGVFVDIDDRDDQKFLSAALAIFGKGILSLAFSKYIVPAVREQLESRLSNAKLLWYATSSDDLKIQGPATAILRNVPFNVSTSDESTLPSEQQNILFVGSFDHRPNKDGIRWFLENCWTDISSKHPTVRLRIVGLGNWQDMAHEFPDYKRVDYVGTVDDIVPEYLNSRIVISSIFEGGGSKIKVIEACAYGRPVVTTSHSARGFGAELANALPKADDPNSFSDTCCKLLVSNNYADELGLTLQRLQRKYFNQEAIEKQIADDITNNILV